MNYSNLPWLKALPALDATCVEICSEEDTTSLVDAVGQVCHHLMQDLGVAWKPHPIDGDLRRLSVEWIQASIHSEGWLVKKRYLLSADAAITYTERIYEGLDLDLKFVLVKYITVAIYLDDMIDKDAETATLTENFLLKCLNGGDLGSPILEHYRKASLNLASRMTDPLAGNMLLHSCTVGIEGCVLEYRNNQANGTMSGISNAAEEKSKDTDEQNLAENGYEIPLPLGADRVDGGAWLIPELWPTWLREQSGASEAFAIPSFCPPEGIKLPIRLWVSVLPEMRHFIMHTNDILSFAKELLEGDSASYISVATKTYRSTSRPGTAPDGGWCLRDTFQEVYTKIVTSASRINRLLRSSSIARYGPDGNVRSIAELVKLLQNGDTAGLDTEDLMKALCMALWETHKNGFVLYHFQAPRYRAYDLFAWVTDMIGERPPGPGWLMSDRLVETK